tara:strand:+ start:698 stop:1864 length:1167 start_codon:yes stop_codon:yes gene_type:complete
MKYKIAILGSTGSIGDNTLDIIRKDKKNFQIVLLTANNNYKKLIKQIDEFKVKNVLIYNEKYYHLLKKKLKNKKINIFSKKIKFNKIFKKKIDYVICGISGIEGLKPTLDAIKFTKTITSANKESIICGWYLIKKELQKHKTKFIPIDSEHFSIWNLTKQFSNDDIEEIVLTASGGPLLNKSIKIHKKISPKKVIKHPNWKMGKKISVDSANLMNKIFEIMEANRMFNFTFSKYKILIHPQSYVHAIVKFKNGIVKMLLHDVDMKIPIFNSIYNDNLKYIKTKKINSKIINNLNFYEADIKKFPSVKLLKKIPKGNSLFDTVITAANDELVDLFLKKKITFDQIVKLLTKIINLKEYKKYYSKKPTSISKIYKVRDLVRLKTRSISVI